MFIIVQLWEQEVGGISRWLVDDAINDARMLQTTWKTDYKKDIFGICRDFFFNILKSLKKGPISCILTYACAF